MENRTKGDRYANLGVEEERGLTDTAIEQEPPLPVNA